MKIYDISQEVFSCKTYPDDPTPQKNSIKTIEKGDGYNLTAFSMCAHNGTHIDAPFHFLSDGKTVDAISLNSFVGLAYVVYHNGVVTKNDALKIMKEEAGVKWDPDVVNALFEVVK